ncbi:MAG: SLATT domain-containing protein [Clostridium sp.]|nr:SLATT domain-containing protein [Clostridium sp.]
MERNSQASQGYKLESQIREAYGRVTYTQTCHDKMIKRFLSLDENIKIAQIILSAITTGSFLVTIISDEKLSATLGAVLSLILLILNTYVKNFNLAEVSQKHQKASDLLWKIREEYVSLLIDFEILDMDKIMAKRDELQNRTWEVYSNSPRTDSKSYDKAKKSLKTEEEQTFSESEIDNMLPNSIRRCNRNISNC